MNDYLIERLKPAPPVDDKMRCCHPCTYPTRFMVGWLYLINSIIFMVMGILIVSYSIPQINHVITQLHDKNNANCSVNFEINILVLAEEILAIYWFMAIGSVLGIPMLFVFIFLPIARKECCCYCY